MLITEPSRSPPNRLDHDIVIVTRNRPEALRMSIPLLLAQTRRASRLIVVDSSEDHDAVRRAVDEVAREAQYPVEVVKAERGMTRQRTLGLQYVRSPVVLYPDDDSLFHPDAAEAMVAVYERDVEELIGGVCGLPASHPPSAETPAPAANGPQPPIGRWDRVKLRMGRRWPRFVNSIAPDPFKIHGSAMMRSARYPPWLSEMNVFPVEWMSGFRMSFRTSLIRDIGFERTFDEYCLFEDISVSFGVFRRGKALVAAHDAAIFHHRFPARRSSGLGMGVWQILNRAFVVCRYSPPGSDARRALHPFARLKLMQYLAVTHTAYGRGLFRGARLAASKIDLLDRSSPEELDASYRQAHAECLGGG